MKGYVALALVGLVLLGLAISAEARGRRSSSHFNFHIGAPLWWGPSPYYRHYPYYHYPYYYEPRTIIIEREPTVYIQRQPVPMTPSPAPAAPAQAQVWFYCTDPAGYYPYVQNCDQPWVSVDPRTVAPPG